MIYMFINMVIGKQDNIESRLRHFLSVRNLTLPIFAIRWHSCLDDW